MKNILLIFGFLFSITIFGQSLNDYNMAIVPSKFSFQKEDNQYRINATIKAFLKQKGFEAYLSNDSAMPEGFMDYNCNKIHINVVEESSMFKTALKIEFKDCNNKVLFVTDFGETREKEYARAYNEVLLLALKSFDKAKYKFSGKTYFDDEAQEKLKAMDKVEVSEVKIKTEKNETLIKVYNSLTQKELILFKTSKQDVFLMSNNGKSGLVLYKDGTWYFEYIENEKLVSEKLDLKF